MSIRTLALCLVVLLAQASLAQVTNNCDGNDIRCLKCYAAPGNSAYLCKRCAYLQTLNAEKCGEQLQIDNCMSQTQKDKCDICNYGYAPDPDHNSCQKLKIDNCIIGKIEDRKIVCGYCNKGYASKLDDGTCVKVEQPQSIDKCLIYQIPKGSEKPQCIQCVKEYSLTASLSCGKKCGEGCAVCDKNNLSCMKCSDVFGYYETSPGKCGFKGLPNGIDPFNTSTNNIKIFFGLIIGMLALTI